MATTEEYGFGPFQFPRGWFVVAEASELTDSALPLHFFGKELVLYRRKSNGAPVILDAYCAHMGTHMGCAKSAILVHNGEQIDGDSIRCPYHGWRYGPDGKVNEIPYFDGPIPPASAINSYEVREIMGCIMMWHDPEGKAPDFDPPFLSDWNDPRAVHWTLDHLGELPVHPTEVLDNMADMRHLGPTHGAPSEYFENEFQDHRCIQRQGGYHQNYAAQLDTITWYTGPGVLLSKQRFGGVLTYEMIANTPVEDGRIRVWHACLSLAAEGRPTDTDRETARQVQAGALQAFAADFEIWQFKRPALKVMQVPTDGPFGKVRRWHSQFYMSREAGEKIRKDLNGLHLTRDAEPAGDRLADLGEGLFD